MSSDNRVDVLAWIEQATVGLPCLRQDSPIALRGPEVSRSLTELIEAASEVLRVSDRDHDYWNRLRAALANIGPTP